MHALTAAELLDVWERGKSATPLQRALLLLAAAFDEVPAKHLPHWNIGRRDAALLQLREQQFGSSLDSFTSCPKCHEQVAFQIQCKDLLPSSITLAPDKSRIRWGDWKTMFRLPASIDLEALNPQATVEDNRRILLTKCILSLHRRRKSVAVDDMPPELEALIVARMAEADPHAELRLDLKCPACSHHWQALLDIVSYFWTELHGWAMRLLRDAHSLAAAYGWTEAEILAMPTHRRQIYLGFLCE